MHTTSFIIVTNTKRTWNMFWVGKLNRYEEKLDLKHSHVWSDCKISSETDKATKCQNRT